jgi:DNA-binding XRE family transcriptional regulator
MPKFKYDPTPHHQSAFLEKASRRPGFRKAYDALEAEYALAHEMLSARTRAGLTQEAVANRMGTTKSAISRLEGAGKHAPSVASLKKYADAVGCTLKIAFVPRRVERSATRSRIRASASKTAHRAT